MCRVSWSAGVGCSNPWSLFVLRRPFSEVTGVRQNPWLKRGYSNRLTCKPKQLPFIETFVPQTSSLNPNLSLTVRNMPPTLRQPNFIKPYRSQQIAARFPTIFFWYGKRLSHFHAKLRKNDFARWDINFLKTELSLLNSCSVNVILRKEGIRAVLWLFRSVVLKLVNKKTRIAQVVRGIYWGIILYQFLLYIWYNY